MLDLLRDGQFFDERTLAASLTVVTYNARVDSLMYSYLDLTFNAEGVEAVGSTSAVPIATDAERRSTGIVVTCVLTLVVFVALFFELRNIARLFRERFHVVKYMSVQRRLWLAIVTIHSLTVVTALWLWWAYMFVMLAEGHAVGPAYDILDNPTGAQPRFLLLRREAYRFVAKPTDPLIDVRCVASARFARSPVPVLAFLLLRLQAVCS